MATLPIRQDDEFHFAFEADGLIEHKPTGDKDADILAITATIASAEPKASSIGVAARSAWAADAPSCNVEANCQASIAAK